MLACRVSGLVGRPASQLVVVVVVVFGAACGWAGNREVPNLSCLLIIVVVFVVIIISSSSSRIDNKVSSALTQMGRNRIIMAARVTLGGSITLAGHCNKLAASRPEVGPTLAQSRLMDESIEPRAANSVSQIGAHPSPSPSERNLWAPQRANWRPTKSSTARRGRNR